MDIDYEIDKKCTRFWDAMKYTLIFILFTTSLLIIGLVFRPGYNKGMEKGKEMEWVKVIFDVEHVGESAIYFCIAALTCLGTVFWIFYGAYGLGTLPVDLIKGSKSLMETKSELSNDLSNIREKYRNI